MCDANSECFRHSIGVRTAHSIARSSQGTRAKSRVSSTLTRCANSTFISLQPATLSSKYRVPTAPPIARRSQGYRAKFRALPMLSRCAHYTFNHSQIAQISSKIQSVFRHSICMRTAHSIARRPQGSRAKFRVFPTLNHCANATFISSQNAKLSMQIYRSQIAKIFEQNSECDRHSLDVPTSHSNARRSQGSQANQACLS